MGGPAGAGPSPERAPEAPANGGGTAFEYGVEPVTVECSSEGDNQGTFREVTLTLHVTNRQALFVPCRVIGFGMTLGFSEGALTTDPATIQSAPGRTTPWAVGGGDGHWDCVPLPPSAGLDPGQRVSFELSGIVVNTVPGKTELTVVERTDAVRETTLDLHKVAAPVPPRPAEDRVH